MPLEGIILRDKTFTTNDPFFPMVLKSKRKGGIQGGKQGTLKLTIPDRYLLAKKNLYYFNGKIDRSGKE